MMTAARVAQTVAGANQEQDAAAATSFRRAPHITSVVGCREVIEEARERLGK